MVEGGNLSHQTRHGHDLRLSRSVDYSDCRADRMELEEVTSELQALRKLYGLLQGSGDGEPHTVQTHLDGRARLLLKDLLDQASERLLKTYSQIITDQLSTRLPCSASSSIQPADSTQETKNSGFEGTNLKTDCTPTSNEAPRSLGTSSSKPGIPNRRCGVCIQNSAMQQAPPEETKGRPMMDSKSKPSVLFQGSRVFLALDKSDPKPARQVKIQPEGSKRDTSPRQEISYAIKRIETQILVLQHLSRLDDPLEGARIPMKEDGTKSPARLGHRIATNLTNSRNPPGERSKSITRRAPSLKSMCPVQDPCARISGQVGNFVHGFRVPQSVAESKMSPRRRVDNESVRKAAQSRVSVPSRDTAYSVISASSRDRMSTRVKNLMGHQKIHASAPVDRKGDKTRSPLRQDSTRKVVRPSPVLRNRQLKCHMESDRSSSGSQESSSYSSSRTSSQDTSPSSSYTGEDGLWSYTDYTDFSPGSRGESEDSGSFSSCSVPRVSPISRSRSPNPGKATGKLRKIKNKLGLIFHHHHHHHHHHHQEGEGDRVQHKSKWKQMGNSILHGANKHRASGGKEVIDRSKKAVGKRSRGGHFQALVEGLLRHVRGNRKKTPRLPDPKGLMRNTKAKKKKKLYWWQMMRRRGGVKLPRGGRRAKLKLPDKRAQLGALKSFPSERNIGRPSYSAQMIKR